MIFPTVLAFATKDGGDYKDTFVVWTEDFIESQIKNEIKAYGNEYKRFCSLKAQTIKKDIINE